MLRDDLIVELAKRKSDSRTAFKAIRGMQHGMKQRHDRADRRVRAARPRSAARTTIERRPREPMPSQLNLLGQFLSPALTSICRSANVATSLAGTATDVRDLIAYRLEFGDATTTSRRC